MTELQTLCQEVLDLYKRVEYLEKTKDEMNEYARRLEEENRKLKYEYPDSKRKRDKALPYKWQRRNGLFVELCPKCGKMISNWQNYCEDCGQKIKQGNPLPENEVEVTE